MKKNVALLMLVTAMIVISGCAQIDHDIMFNGDFSGKCTSKVLFIMPVTQEEFQKMLEEKGIKNAVITPYKEEIVDGNTKTMLNGYMVITSWKTIDEFQKYLSIFSPEQKKITPVKQNDDGSILVDFGLNHAHSMKIHVDGSIRPESTKGKVLDSNTIEFTGEEQIVFTYKPSNNTGIIAITVILALAILGVIYVNHKKTRGTA